MRARRLVAVAMLLLSGIVLTSCASKMARIDPSFVRPLRIAVVRLENWSNDLRAETEFRQLLTYGLQDRGYTTANLDDVDALLARQGITDGGQIPRFSPAQYCSMLGSEAVILGTIQKASQKTLGVYNSNTFRVSLKLFIGDKEVWSDTSEQVGRSGAMSATDAAAKFADRAAGRALRKIRGHPLLDQMELAVYDLLKPFPGKVVRITGWEAMESK